MTYNESLPLAKMLAEQTLERGFDVEAFLVLSVINQLPQPDLVPDTNIDECIENLLNEFVHYYNNKSVDTLKPLTKDLNQILSELYHTFETVEEQNLFKNFIDNLNEIVT